MPSRSPVKTGWRSLDLSTEDRTLTLFKLNTNGWNLRLGMRNDKSRGTFEESSFELYVSIRSQGGKKGKGRRRRNSRFCFCLSVCVCKLCVSINLRDEVVLKDGIHDGQCAVSMVMEEDDKLGGWNTPWCMMMQYFLQVFGWGSPSFNFRRFLLTDGSITFIWHSPGIKFEYLVSVVVVITSF